MSGEERRFQDGTSQKDRMSPALDPGYFSVEERSFEELLKLARQYAGKLKYFNASNQVDGDWSGFLDFDDQELRELASFVEDPESFREDEEKRAKFSRPHLVLFLAFLKLLDHPREQFRNLTARHLDYYYREILKLGEKPETADKLHVVFQLADSVSEHSLKKGTLIDAGEDSDGLELFYALEKDMALNRAVVGEALGVRVEQITADLEYIHQKYGRDTEEGFEKILERALGNPNMDDPLPSLVKAGQSEVRIDLSYLREKMPPGVFGLKDGFFDLPRRDGSLDFESFKQTLTAGGHISGEEIGELGGYIVDELGFVRAEDFIQCLEVFERELIKGEDEVEEPADEEWRCVYELIEKAYRKRITLKRRAELKQIQAEKGFEAMMEHALGEEKTNRLEPIPGGKILDELFSAVQDESGPDYSQCAGYIENSLLMTVADFKIVADPRTSDDPAGHRLLEEAWARKKLFKFPPLARSETLALRAEIFYDPDDPEKKDFKRFNPFVSKNGSDEYKKEKDPLKHRVGFGLFSPLFELREGEREISLKLECEEESFRPEVLEEIIERGERPFEIFLNTSEGWLEAKETTFDAGDLIVGEPLAVYQQGLGLVCRSESGVDSGYNYICFENGRVYEIVNRDDPQKIALRSTGGEKDGFALWICESIRPLNPVYLDETSAAIEMSVVGDGKEIEADRECFSQEHSGRFLWLKDGRTFQIEEFADTKHVKALYRGKSQPGPDNPKIGDAIEFVNKTEAPPGAFEIIGISSESDLFADADKDRLIVWDNGQIFEITKVADARTLETSRTGVISNCGEIQKRDPSSVCFNSLYFQITLKKDFPELIETDGESAPDNPAPNIKIVLKEPEEGVEFYYDQFKSIRLKKVSAVVKAKDLTDLRIRNDISGLDPETPFEIFGYSPKPGSGFYFFNKEICSKRLTSLKLKLEWLGRPEDLREYYRSYQTVGEAPDINDQDFKARLDLFDRRAWTRVGERPLFELNENPFYEFNIEGYSFKRLDEEEEPLKMKSGRFFKLELGARDFMHDLYFAVQSRVSFHNSKAVIDQTPVAEPPNQPYTPLVKSVSLDYAAEAEIDFSAKDDGSAGEVDFFHIHPFGRRKLSGRDSLLPVYESRSYLYIGLKDLEPGRDISLLFQVSAADSGYEEDVPEIVWSYLNRSGWMEFRKEEVLSDTTRGLLNSGVLQLNMPEDAVSDRFLTPPGMIWIRAELRNNPQDAPDIIDIKTQAATAVFQNREKPSSHLNRPLPAGSALGLANPDPAVKSVSQPYSSFGGRPTEEPEMFRVRAAERLRHKQRASTTWDYERLVLEKFPEVYKVKCLRGSDLESSKDKDDAVVVVIPDISGTAPFFPLEPKAPSYLLEEIKSYLGDYSSPFIRLRVKNPRYQQIQYRFGVKFKSGVDQGYCLKQLNEDLKRFLSPWAYEEQADVPFCGAIHSSAVTRYIEKRPYVEYIAGLRLIESFLEGFGESSDNYNPDWARVSSPDAILVSASEHIIDLISGETYEKEDFEGIGHNIIGVDLIIDE